MSTGTPLICNDEPEYPIIARQVPIKLVLKVATGLIYSFEQVVKAVGLLRATIANFQLRLPFSSTCSTPTVMSIKAISSWPSIPRNSMRASSIKPAIAHTPSPRASAAR